MSFFAARKREHAVRASVNLSMTQREKFAKKKQNVPSHLIVSCFYIHILYNMPPHSEGEIKGFSKTCNNLCKNGILSELINSTPVLVTLVSSC